MRGRPCRRLKLVATALVALLTVAAGPWKEEMTRGSRALTQGLYEEAAASFEAAAQADPADPQAPFFAGVALNRLERPTEALAHLDRAAVLGAAQPTLPFERGWSHFLLHHWDAAIEHFSQFEHSHPGRAQTQAFLGGAYRAKGDLARSEAAFARAVALDPRLADVVAVYRQIPPPPPPPAPPSARPAAPPDRPWNLSLTTAVGYSSNARGAEVLEPLAVAIPDRPSSFGRFAVDVDYTFTGTAEDQLTLDVHLASDVFAEREISADEIRQAVSAEYRRPLAGPLAAVVRLSSDYWFAGGQNYRYQLEGRAGLDWQVAPDLVLRGAFAYQHNDFLLEHRSLGTVLNQDAQTRIATLDLAWRIPGTGILLRGGYFYTLNAAYGRDYDYESNGAFAAAQVPLPWGLTLDLFGAYSVDRYDNISSLDATLRRRDEVLQLSARLTAALNRGVDLYVEYEYNRDDSNLVFFHYDQHVISTGVVWKF